MFVSFVGGSLDGKSMHVQPMVRTVSVPVSNGDDTWRREIYRIEIPRPNSPWRLYADGVAFVEQ